MDYGITGEHLSAIGLLVFVMILSIYYVIEVTVYTLAKLFEILRGKQ